jgi:hypothetical protein
MSLPKQTKINQPRTTVALNLRVQASRRFMVRESRIAMTWQQVLSRRFRGHWAPASMTDLQQYTFPWAMQTGEPVFCSTVKVIQRDRGSDSDFEGSTVTCRRMPSWFKMLKTTSELEFLTEW